MNIEQELEAITRFCQEDSEIANSLLNAKEFFFESCGKIIASDINYQTRMNCFLNWFLFDWKLNNNQNIFKTIVSRYGKNELKTYQNQFFNNIHSIFILLKKKKTENIIYDLYTKKKYKIEKEFFLQEFFKKTCFETRVFIINEKYYLSNYILIHPERAMIYIKNSIKNKKDLKKFIFYLHKCYYKWHTYRHFQVSQIYCD